MSQEDESIPEGWKLAGTGSQENDSDVVLPEGWKGEADESIPKGYKTSPVERHRGPCHH